MDETGIKGGVKVSMIKIPWIKFLTIIFLKRETARVSPTEPGPCTGWGLLRAQCFHEVVHDSNPIL